MATASSKDKELEAEGHEVTKVVDRAWPGGVALCSDQERDLWPSSGRHILASYDDHSVTVYQAFCPAIAEPAVKNQRFGGGGFSFMRMSWIKTNFLWMMYRCGWATKKNQERVLAVRITLDGFNQILAQAMTAKFQKSGGHQLCGVRLQWDPDHTPSGTKLARRAIQLGLKDQILQKYCTEWVVSITDVTPFVQEQYRVLQDRGDNQVLTPRERVYTPPDPDTRQRIELD